MGGFRGPWWEVGDGMRGEDGYAGEGEREGGEERWDWNEAMDGGWCLRVIGVFLGHIGKTVHTHSEVSVQRVYYGMYVYM